MRKTLQAFTLLCAGFIPAAAQLQEVTGKVIATSGDSVTVTRGGNTVIVKVSKRTRIVSRTTIALVTLEPLKLKDIRVEEIIRARGTLKDNVLEAAGIEVLRGLPQAPAVPPRIPPRPFAPIIDGLSFGPEDMGKKYIEGEVRAARENRFSVLRPDRILQEIEVNENTIFRSGSQRITVHDVTVGDRIKGRGGLTGNLFTAWELSVVGSKPERNGRISLSIGTDLVMGKVSAVGMDFLTITNPENGNIVVVKVNERAEILRQTQPGKWEPAKLESIRMEEKVIARGTLKDGVLEVARIMVDVDRARQQLQPGGGVIVGVIGPSIRPDDMGKKFVAGQVTEILTGRLTVLMPDRRMLAIEVNENTSLTRDGHRITVHDVRVGDQISGPGELKDNVFVPKALLVFSPVQTPDSMSPLTFW